jgi:hypothetical protein
MTAIVSVYVSLIIKKRRKYSSTPENLKPEVMKALIDLGRQDLIDE